MPSLHLCLYPVGSISLHRTNSWGFCVNRELRSPPLTQKDEAWSLPMLKWLKAIQSAGKKPIIVVKKGQKSRMNFNAHSLYLAFVTFGWFWNECLDDPWSLTMRSLGSKFKTFWNQSYFSSVPSFKWGYFCICSSLSQSGLSMWSVSSH